MSSRPFAIDGKLAIVAYPVFPRFVVPASSIEISSGMPIHSPSMVPLESRMHRK
jgi:hypothetical protein